MLLLWATLFFVSAIVLGFFAFGGIAVAISFFTKIILFFSVLCFAVSLVLVVIDRMNSKRSA